MARLSENRAGSRNALAFLDMLAWAEGTSTSPATNMDGYDVIVTGIDKKPEVYNDFTDHPFSRGRKSKVINSRGLTSNASGRYQQMFKDWPHYRAQLDLPDFSPISQDLLALQVLSIIVNAIQFALQHSQKAPGQPRDVISSEEQVSIARAILAAFSEQGFQVTRAPSEPR